MSAFLPPKKDLTLLLELIIVISPLVLDPSALDKLTLLSTITFSPISILVDELLLPLSLPKMISLNLVSPVALIICIIAPSSSFKSLVLPPATKIGLISDWFGFLPNFVLTLSSTIFYH